jgi:hypothetical protein
MKRLLTKTQPVRPTDTILVLDTRKSQRPSIWKRWRLTIVLPVVFALLAIAVIAWLITHNSSQDKNLVPSRIVSQVTYPVYYVASLPGGIRLDRNSFEITDKVILYNLIDGKDTLYVSQQGNPVNYDFEDFNTKQMESTQAVITPVGRAILGIFNGKFISSIVTDKTWIIVSTPIAYPADKLSKISQSLKLQ